MGLTDHMVHSRIHGEEASQGGVDVIGSDHESPRFGVLWDAVWGPTMAAAVPSGTSLWLPPRLCAADKYKSYYNMYESRVQNMGHMDVATVCRGMRLEREGSDPAF